VLFSLVSLIQPAQDENEANKNICQINNIICETKISDTWVAAGIFEADEIENFAGALQENLNQFIKEYKEKCNNV
jgi:hypothetical protein